MKKDHLAIKVGLFVTLALVITAVMVMKFSKGAGMFTKTYTLRLRAADVGGIIPGANVLMAGVSIGRVKEITLAGDGRSVVMHSEILSEFRIRTNAVFQIRQAGFLGDRFISVTPAPASETHAPEFKDGDHAQCQETFDITQVAQSASGLMQRMDTIVSNLNRAVTRVDTTLLAEQSLTNLTQTISNFRTMSERAMTAVDNIDAFVKTNTTALAGGITNFNVFTDNLNVLTLELRSTLATNRVQITQSIQNIENATAQITNLLADVQAGKGVVGNLLSNPDMARNLSLISSNFAVFSENLNERGLWGVFRKPKEKK